MDNVQSHSCQGALLSSSDIEWTPPISQCSNASDPAQASGDTGLSAGSPPHLWKNNALKTLLCMTSSSWEKERSLEVIISFSLNPVFCLPQFQLAYLCILRGPLERKKCPGLDIARGITFYRDLLQTPFITKRKQPDKRVLHRDSEKCIF